MSLHSLTTSLVLALLATPALHAQNGPNPRPAPQWLLNAYDVTAGELQDLTIPALRTPFEFLVALGDTTVTVRLEPNDIRSPDFRLLLDDGVSLTPLPTPAAITWKGSVIGFPEAAVAASIVDRRLQAIVRLDDHDGLIWGIEPASTVDPSRPIAEHLVYRSADSNRQGTSCGTDTSHWHPIGGPGTDIRKEAEIAIDADLEFYQRNGSNSTTTTNTITTVVNGIDTIYRRDIDLQYVIRTIIIRTTGVYVNSDMGNLLGEFASRWGGNHGGVQRDLAHLFTGKGSFSGVVGIAYVGVVCGGSAYGVSKVFSNLVTNIGLVAHETGHNWNAPHCDGQSPCYIMCSGLGGCSGNVSLFAPASIAPITSFKNSAGCLSSPQVRPVVTGISPSTAAILPSQTITLTGTGFTGVTTVNVGTVTANPVQVTDTSLRFGAPIPTALGATFVSITNSVGTSAPVTMTYTATNPPIYNCPAFAIGGANLPLQMAGDPSDVWAILASFNDPTTVSALGFDILLHNVVLSTGQLSAVGYQSLPYSIPSITLTGLAMYSQVVFLDESTLQISHVTPYLTTTFF